MAYLSRTSKGSDLTQAELDANINAMGGYHGNVHAYFFNYYLQSWCYHNGDTNTYFGYSNNDALNFVANGTTMLASRYYGQYLYRGYREDHLRFTSQSGTKTLYPYNERVAWYSLSGNISFTVGTTSADYNHMNGLIIINQDATGGRTVSWNSSFVQQDGDIGLDLSPSAYNVIPYYYHSGTYYLGKAWAGPVS